MARMDVFMKEVVLDVDMFNMLVERGIFGEVDSGVIVAKDRSRARWREAYARE